MHNREALYRAIWENWADRHGMIRGTQQEISKELGLPYQRLSVIFSEWTKEGKLKKFRSKFQMRDPDRFDWSKKSRKSS